MKRRNRLSKVFYERGNLSIKRNDEEFFVYEDGELSMSFDTYESAVRYVNMKHKNMCDNTFREEE